jgi:glycerophosphoryl diester phosphodiesterase
VGEGRARNPTPATVAPAPRVDYRGRVNPFVAGARRPLVVGHRGVPRLHQENTLAGFRRAVALGLPAVELDVMLSADGVPVVFHDADVDRLTDGHGAVADLTWDRLARLRLRRELDYGVDAAGAPVVVRYPSAEPIARLDEVLAELGGRVAVNVELKLGLPRWWQTAVGARTAEVIAAAGAAATVIVTSFDPRKLAAAHRVLPALTIGFCFDDTMLDFSRPLLDRLEPWRSWRSAARTARPNPHVALERILGLDLVGRVLPTRVVGAEHTLIGPAAVAALHRRGVAVGTHTMFPLGTTTKRPDPSASSPTEVARLVAAGVDWIETDDPERLMGLT